jgi:hypothetical protein
MHPNQINSWEYLPGRATFLMLKLAFADASAGSEAEATAIRLNGSPSLRQKFRGPLVRAGLSSAVCGGKTTVQIASPASEPRRGAGTFHLYNQASVLIQCGSGRDQWSYVFRLRRQRTLSSAGVACSGQAAAVHQCRRQEVSDQIQE